MSEPKKGDFVTVTIRGEVSEVNNRDIVVGPFSGFGCTIIPRNAEGHEVRVSVVEPPVEVFKPGDVVRDRKAPEYLFAIGKGGYLSISEGQWWPASAGDTPWTSRDFERVELS